MCSRYTLRKSVTELATAYRAMIDELVGVMPARYNIAPSQPILVMLRGEGAAAGSASRRMKLLRWGLVPHWAKSADAATSLINARLETVREKPAFRDAMKYRRCVIPADGFYEWTTQHGRKQPWFFHTEHDEAWGFAGLWEHWQDAHGNELETCALVTTEAAGEVAKVHDRMPVMLTPDAAERWMELPVDEAVAWATQAAQQQVLSRLQRHAVHPRMGNPRIDESRCVQAVKLEQQGELFGGSA